MDCWANTHYRPRTFGYRMSMNNLDENIRVLVVEDHAIVREGVCILLEREPDIQVLASVGSGEEAVEFLQEAEPNVILMDLGLPGMSGIEATRKVMIEKPNVRVLALTMHTDDQYLLGMLDAGAVGYVLKQSATNDLVQAVRTVSRGQIFLNPSATKTVVDSMRKGAGRSSSVDALTDREKDILRLIGKGCTSKDIGQELFLSPKTVENYRARILKKLQVKNCSEAVSSAMKQGIIEPVS